MIKRPFGILLLACIVFCPKDAFSWSWSANFEQGTVGQPAQGASGFDYAATRTTYTNEIAHSGTKSCKFDWLRGVDGFDTCSAWWGYDASAYRVSNGGEIWVRGYYYFKSPWSWTCDPAIKILRAAIRTASDQNRGYHSIFSNTNGQVTLSNEVQDYQPESTVAFGVNQWVCLELYVKFSPTAPIVRIWRDGVLVFEDKSHRTLELTSDYFAGGGWVMSYWNDGAPQDQVMYVDDFAATTDRPNKQDAHGNWMIGPDDWGGGGGDTTAPTVSITTSDPSSITSDSLKVSGKASDAIWGTGSVCKWRISAAPDADNGTTISGLTYSGTVDWSFTASGFSRGSNTLYVGCRDAVPNWGSKSMTVNYNPSSQGISGVSGLTVR